MRLEDSSWIRHNIGCRNWYVVQQQLNQSKEWRRKSERW